MTEDQSKRRQRPWSRLSATSLVGIVACGLAKGALGFAPVPHNTLVSHYHKRQGLCLYSRVEPPRDEKSAYQKSFASNPATTVLTHSPARLGEVLEGKGRGRMVWKSLARGRDPFERDPEMPGYDPDVTQKTRDLLTQRIRRSPWQVVQRYQSSCGTEKALVSMEDGSLVETVVIPSANRTTVCISSQVGCAQACGFCSTGMMGFKRHLTTDEILMQVHLACQITREKCLPPLRNIVFMGMGEPLNNAACVTEALCILCDRHAFAFSPGFITVSTVAPSPAHIERLVGMPAKLAWSVHAADDVLRKALVPTTHHTMVELRDTFLKVMDIRGDDEIFVEVTLIEGINDNLEDADKLAEFLLPFGKRCKVNVIPYNDTGVPGFRASSLDRVRAFQARVREKGGWPTFIRMPRGRDEKVACGQLATEGMQARKERLPEHVSPSDSLSPGRQAYSAT